MTRPARCCAIVIAAEAAPEHREQVDQRADSRSAGRARRRADRPRTRGSDRTTSRRRTPPASTRSPRRCARRWRRRAPGRAASARAAAYVRSGPGIGPVKVSPGTARSFSVTSLTEVPFRSVRSFVRMLGFLRPHLRGSVWSLVLSCLAIAGTVAIPLLLGAAVERDRATATATRCCRCRWRSSAPASCASRSPIPRRLISGKVSLGVEYDLRNRVYRHLQSLELGLLRPPADRPADVARDRRPAVRALLPRLRADLHPPEPAHDPARGGGDVRAAAVARRDHARARAARDPRGRALRPPLAPGAAGGAAADRGADRGGRGEHLRHPRREGVRARGGAPGALHAQGRPRVRPEHVLDPAARLLQPDDLVPAEPRARGGAAGRRPPGRATARSPWASSSPSTPTC